MTDSTASARLPIERLAVVAGMSRAGTTFLYHNLGKHPEIFVPSRKELCYFGHHHDRGRAWFESFYRQIHPGETALDVCGLYFMDERAPGRILDYAPDARVVLGIREPVDWAFSLYEKYRGSFTVPPLVEFFSGCTIEREGRRIRLDFEEGMLRRKVERFRSAFGGRLLVYDFRLLADDSLGLLRSIEAFLGLAPYFDAGNYTDSRINARGRRRWGPFDRMLQRPGFAEALTRLVPRRLLLAARGAVDAAASRGADARRPAGPRQRYTPEEIAFVDRLFAADRRFVADLFASEKLLRPRG